MVKEYKFPAPEPEDKNEGEQLELSLDGLAGAGDIFKNYEKMWHAVDKYIQDIPNEWKNKAIQSKWGEIKSRKHTDEELRKKFLETSEKDWEEDPAYYYALILEATERKLFL